MDNIISSHSNPPPPLPSETRSENPYRAMAPITAGLFFGFISVGLPLPVVPLFVRILKTEAQQQREATTSTEESLQLFNNRYQGGVDNYLQVITAQTVFLTNQRNDIDIHRRRMDASVLLVKAIGGGWDTSQLPRF